MEGINLAYDWEHWWILLNTAMNLQILQNSRNAEVFSSQKLLHTASLFGETVSSSEEAYPASVGVLVGEMLQIIWTFFWRDK